MEIMFLCRQLRNRRKFLPMQLRKKKLCYVMLCYVMLYYVMLYELRSFRLRVVSPTVCSPTVRVDSSTSHMSVRLRVKTCVTTVDSSTLCAIAIQFLERDS